jgi:hypothetical protein
LSSEDVYGVPVRDSICGQTERHERARACMTGELRRGTSCVLTSERHEGARARMTGELRRGTACVMLVRMLSGSQCCAHCS